MKFTHALADGVNRVLARDLDVPIHLIKARTQKDLLIRSAIHLLRPTQADLSEAAADAVMQGITRVVVHNARTWANKADRATSNVAGANRRIVVY